MWRERADINGESTGTNREKASNTEKSLKTEENGSKTGGISKNIFI